MSNRVVSASDRIRNIVNRMLVARAIRREVDAEDDLSEVGLSSLDLANLVLSVEAEFSLTIPDDYMVPGNFRSISAINSLVTALL